MKYFSSQKLLPDGPQIVWVLGSPREGNEPVIYVLHKLSTMAQICLLSLTSRYLFCRSSIRWVSNPSLHFSLSGTLFTGSISLTLHGEYHSACSCFTTFLMYLRYTNNNPHIFTPLLRHNRNTLYYEEFFIECFLHLFFDLDKTIISSFLLVYILRLINIHIK